MTAREVLDGIKGRLATRTSRYEPYVAFSPDEMNRLTGSLEAVLNVHAPRIEGSDEPYCRHCHQSPYGHAPYPCPTVAAIENALTKESQ